MTSPTLTCFDLTDALQPHLGAARWWLAFSGGLDSTVLLHLLQDFCRRRPDSPPLHAVHINHGLHSQASHWAAHCEAVCAALEVPLILRRVKVAGASGLGLEAAARDGRYTAFEQLLQPGDCLLMAHHLDDQVETFFLRLLRGAGLQGLAAMPAQRTLGSGLLLRPLLGCSREQLQRYAHEQALHWIDDPSNEDTGLDRNYLREQVLPLLARRWPGYRTTVSRAATHLAGARELAAAALPAVVSSSNEWGDSCIAVTSLSSLPDHQAAEQLRAWLRSEGCHDLPDRNSLVEFLRQLRTAAIDSHPRLHSGKLVLQRYRGRVFRLPAPAEWSAPARLPIRVGQAVSIAGVGVVSLQPAAGGIALAAGDALELRWRTGGEQLRSASGEAGQSLKHLLQEQAVPPWWRARLPLLFRGDQLLAVADLWQTEQAQAAGAGSTSSDRWQLHWKRNSAAASD